ncbi:hypothetical protein ACQU0X_26870 [Pseudovibrio ascidiaceicola]|uniref:hypothetical protein n=1 Tax=Pseudovibrio ascidiaceicola TaxID=285279 RepID=UPI003D36EEE1
MKNSRRFSVAAGLLASTVTFVALPSTSAQAALSYKAYKRHAEKVVRDGIMEHTTTVVNSAQVAIVEAIRLMTGQMSGNMQTQTGARHTLADQQDDRSVVKSIEEVRVKAIMDAVSGTSSCSAITATQGGQLLNDSANYEAELAKQTNEWLEGAPGMPSSRGPNAAMNARVQMSCSQFATEADVQAEVCTDVGELAGMDVNADAVFYPQENGNSIAYTPETEKAHAAYVMHAYDPYGYKPLDPAELNTPAGFKDAARRKTFISRMNLATSPDRYVSSQNKGNESQKLVDWAKGAVSKMEGYQNMNLDSLSKRQYLEILSRKYALDQKFLTNMNMSPAQAAKDTVNILAGISYQGYDQYLVAEKTLLQESMQTALLTQILHIMETQAINTGMPLR